MKIFKKTLLVFASIILFSAVSYAQPDNVIKVNLLSPFVKSGSFFYERALNEEMSLVGGFFFTAYEPEDVKLSGFGVTLEYRYYLSEKPAPSGAYLAPFGRYQSFTISDETDEGSLNSIGGGLLVGYQRLFKERITLEAFIGPAYYNSTISVEGEGAIEDPGLFDGFTVRFGVTVGFAF